MKIPVLGDKRQIITKDRQAQAIARLNRIGGQIEGLKRMIESQRPCVEVLMQLASVQEALRG